MDPNTYFLFDYVLDNPQIDFQDFNTTSNFSVDAKIWSKYKEYVQRLCEGETVEHFMQFVSSDNGASKQNILDMDWTLT